jgi:Holliday junction DNA helicase RuvA
MISRLEGVLVRDGEHVIVDCNGVGYEVTCSAYTMAALPSHGERVVLKVYTQLRETALALFGFIDAHERDLFDLLITVKNVGPSTAIAILSGAGPRDIAALIAREDVPGLTKIKGIGKKTAELLVVELREKCELMVLSWNAVGGIKPVAAHAGSIRTAKVTRHPMLGEVMTALINMGWRPAEAEAVVAELPVEDGVTIEALLRQALRGMPR